ncbi:MAG TPA: hypothetical protein VLG74_15660, partial [Blastocatellia bacterium]|nr:hypothetical protein [Blastocatellia bacterium]
MKRITVPLTISVLFLLVYLGVQLFLPGMLGQSVAKYVMALLLLGLSVAMVRSISYVLFDV